MESIKELKWDGIGEEKEEERAWDYKGGRSEELNTNGRKSISERALHKQSATSLLSSLSSTRFGLTLASLAT
jgi:hypothetical protein